MMEITTKQLHIRPYAENDRDALIDILTHPRVNRYFMVPDYPEREQYYTVFENMRRYALAPEHYAGGVYYEDKLVGLVLDVEQKDGMIEMGYAMHPDYHNRGFCTEAMQGVIEYLFSKGFTRVTAGAFEGNAASMRVMEKCGMKRLPHTDLIDYRGKTHTCIYYGI